MENPNEQSERTQLLNDALTTARAMVPTYTRWRHKKGGLYLVTGHEVDSDDGLIRVVYKRVGGPGFVRLTELDISFSRPIAEWTPDRFVFVA